MPLQTSSRNHKFIAYAVEHNRLFVSTNALQWYSGRTVCSFGRRCSTFDAPLVKVGILVVVPRPFGFRGTQFPSRPSTAPGSSERAGHSTTRRAGRNYCNHDAPAGFAAARLSISHSRIRTLLHMLGKHPTGHTARRRKFEASNLVLLKMRCCGLGRQRPLAGPISGPQLVSFLYWRGHT
ncbi:MAG: hypothetical protein JWM16_5902 [Verrucomicrobiales bacterium]|nr:hypothetical protein [Verrucomicrobiales bacterium]